MARCPFAQWRPVALRASQRVAIKPQGLVLHTAVSNGTVVTPSGITRWHFYAGKTGTLYQFFDTEVPAACQLDGNYWRADGEGRGFVSVESWDGAGTSVWPDYRSNPNGGPAWTPAQVEVLARLAAWLHDVHGIPLIKATGARGRGIGYHRQFQNTEPYEWTSSHACPGARRIAQVPGIIDRAQRLAGATPEPLPVEEDMDLSDQMPVPQWLIDRFPEDKGMADGKMSIRTALASGYAHSRTARAEIAELRERVEQMAENIKAIHEALSGPQKPPASEPGESDPRTYTVQRGDTLSAIAGRFSVTVRELAEANNLSDPSRIFPGQVLTIP